MSIFFLKKFREGIGKKETKKGHKAVALALLNSCSAEILD
jgi:hypothetical protein